MPAVHRPAHSIDSELYPPSPFVSRSFNAMPVPREMFIQALNHNPVPAEVKGPIAIIKISGIKPFYRKGTSRRPDLGQLEDSIFHAYPQHNHIPVAMKQMVRAKQLHLFRPS
jgi:hypothetical protein